MREVQMSFSHRRENVWTVNWFFFRCTHCTRDVLQA